MDASHDFLSPSTCAFAQSCIGAFSIKPEKYKFLELIDYFIVSNHCVSDICASEVIARYFNIQRLNFYVSYTKTGNSLKYFKLELLDLKKQLEEIKGTEIDAQVLMNSIKKYNNFKKKLLEISNAIISGSQKLKIFQKAMLYGPDILPELDNMILEQSQTQTSNQVKDILLTGCSIFIDDYLNDLIEEGGGNILFFDTWVGFNYYYQIIEEKAINTSKDSIDLLVHRFEKNIYGDHSVPNFLERKVSHIETFCRNYEKKT
jgi:benzoyl-CoA reductase/2-hydroxyglutaryl-CoA dehydratase subunit BcrC/BadD/HgdB